MVAFEAIEKGVKPGAVAEFSNDCKKWFKRELKEVENLPKGFTTDAGDEAVKRKVSRWTFMRLIPKPEQIGIEFGIPERSQREVIFDKIALERIRQDGKWGSRITALLNGLLFWERSSGRFQRRLWSCGLEDGKRRRCTVQRLLCMKRS